MEKDNELDKINESLNKLGHEIEKLNKWIEEGGEAKNDLPQLHLERKQRMIAEFERLSEEKNRLKYGGSIRERGF